MYDVYKHRFLMAGAIALALLAVAGQSRAGCIKDAGCASSGCPAACGPSCCSGDCDVGGGCLVKAEVTVADCPSGTSCPAACLGSGGTPPDVVGRATITAAGCGGDRIVVVCDSWEKCSNGAVICSRCQTGTTPFDTTDLVCTAATSGDHQYIVRAVDVTDNTGCNNCDAACGVSSSCNNCAGDVPAIAGSCCINVIP